jgi:hypothetical protein
LDEGNALPVHFTLALKSFKAQKQWSDYTTDFGICKYGFEKRRTSANGIRNGRYLAKRSRAALLRRGRCVYFACV